MKTMPKPMNKKPWCWLDTETTGLSPFEDPKTRRAYDSSGPVSLGSRVIQVAVKVTSDSLGPWTRGGRREYSSNVKIPVDALAAAAPKALEVNGFAQVVATRNTARALGCYLAQPVGDRFAPGEEVTEAVLAEAESAYASLSEGSLKSMLHPIKEPAVWVMRDPARWFDAPPPEEVWPIVHSMLSGCHLVCQNVPFDKPFIEAELHGVAHHGGGERDDRGDGEVDLARNDDQCHGKGDHRLFGKIGRCVGKVIGIEEIGRQQTVSGHHQNQQHRQQQFPSAHQSQPPGERRRR